jgi:hypothetical protein
MAGLKLQVSLGKMAQPRHWTRCGFYRRGKVRKSAYVRESLVGLGLVLEWEFLFKGGAFFYHFPIFSLIMMEVGREDQELG